MLLSCTFHFTTLSRTFVFNYTMIVRRILAFYLSGLMLLTQIGIPVFTHVCRGQEKVSMVAFGPAKSCCSKRTHQLQANALSATTERIQKMPCCEDRTEILKVKADFVKASESPVLKHIESALPALPAYVSIFSQHSIVDHPLLSFIPHAAPIPLHGRSLLIFEQNFRC